MDFLKSIIRFWLAILLVVVLALVYLFPIWLALYVALAFSPKHNPNSDFPSNTPQGETHEQRTHAS